MSSQQRSLPETESAWDRGIRTHCWKLRVGRECESGNVKLICVDPCDTKPKNDGTDCACHHISDDCYDIENFDVPVTFTHEGAYAAGWIGSEWDEGDFGRLVMEVQHG